MSYRIAGQAVLLRFAGQTLIPSLTPALEHLASALEPDPALTIELWDGRTTSVIAPTPPWTIEDYSFRGEILGFNDRRFDTLFQVDIGNLTLLDAECGRAVYWIRDDRSLRYYEIASPLRLIFHGWMRRRGLRLVHAAALGIDRAGVLLPGKGFSGKTTVTLACLGSGIRCAGDNYVLLDEKRGPEAHSLFSSIAIHEDNLRRRFPFLLDKVGREEKDPSGKVLIFLHKHEPAFFISRIPIRAILLPRIIGGNRTRLRRISSAASLLSLAPPSLLNLPGTGCDDFRALADFVRDLPGFVLELGEDISEVPGILGEFLARF